MILLILGIIATSAGFSVFWSKTLQIYIYIHRNKPFSESGVTPFLLALLLFGGVAMMVLGLKSL